MPSAKASIVGPKEAERELIREEIASEEVELDANESRMWASDAERRDGFWEGVIPMLEC